MLRRVALVRTDASEELGAFIIRVCRLLVTANVPSSPILVTLMVEMLSSSETSVLTGATWRNIPEDCIRHSHRRENLKCYKFPPCTLLAISEFCIVLYHNYFYHLYVLVL
jgi:hypothetical protein